jgi:ribosomal protein L22
MAEERKREPKQEPSGAGKDKPKRAEKSGRADAAQKGERADAGKKGEGAEASGKKRAGRRGRAGAAGEAKESGARARGSRSGARAARAGAKESAQRRPPAEAKDEKSDEAPKSAARTRRRPAAARPAPERPVVRAQAKYVRASARKARLVIEHIRGKSLEEARATLRHSPRGIARDLEKLLASAVANAENNHDLVGDDLLVKDVYADEGPTIKRYRPRALGRATRIRKRTSHLTVALTPKE